MHKLFTPVDWSLGTSIYEVNVRQYTPSGTFNAFSEHLPRLWDMGIKTLWFMPITPISVEKRLGVLGSYYACSDYTRINPEFGSLKDFKNLVNHAHELGFKVIIDWVANHTGWDHIWTKKNPGFYKQNAKGNFYDTNGWEDVIDLNYYDQQMRKEMKAAMQYWVEECDIDGFRCDMAHLIPLDFWKEARLQLDKIKPLFWLAETATPVYLTIFDACYAWDWMHKSEAYMRKEVSFQELAHLLLNQHQLFPIGSQQLLFTSNHDENSWNGTEYEKYGDAAGIMAVWHMTWWGIPLVYSGQELPLLKRLKFFEKDLIDWTSSPSLHNFYKTLLLLRDKNEALTSLPETWPVTELGMLKDNILAFSRKKGEQEVKVVLNFTAHAIECVIPDSWKQPGTFTDSFSRKSVVLQKLRTVHLPAWGYLVWEK